MLIGRVVDDQLCDHAKIAPLGFLHEAAEVLHGAKIGIDLAVVRDVITVIAAGGGIERQQPQGRDPELLKVVELLGEPDEIADAIIIAVGERLDMQLIDDRVLKPELVCIELGVDLDIGSDVHGVSGVTAKDQGRVLLLIDAQTHASPFEDMPLPGDEIFERLDPAPCMERANLDLSEVEPERARSFLRQGDRDSHGTIVCR